MAIVIELDGMGKLQKKINQMADIQPFKNVLKANTARLQRTAQRNAPIDTGTLMRSILLEMRDNGMTGIVGATAEYAAYVEYGTRFMNAQPYLDPAMTIVRKQYIKELEQLLKAGD